MISSGVGLRLKVRTVLSTAGANSLRSVVEFEFAEKLAAGGVVDRLRSHRFEIVLDGNGGVDGDEFLRQQDVVAVVLQRFAIGLLLDLIGAIECGFDGAELLDELDGALVADCQERRGMLSIESPRSAITSTTRCGGTPRIFSTPAGSRIRLSLVGFRIETFSFTSCIMSLSDETT